MTEAEALYEFIRDKLCKEDGVAIGKMMSAPAIKCKGKVFTFFHNEKMTFKLGKDFEPEEEGLQNCSFLSPFKNKPPMRAWVNVPFEEKDRWEDLARLALDKIR
ncbi:MAG: hypothetical protein KTR30_05675 [Saprospiraceae bacterium]|nr:hypothetical protein [Saprospiraceae bacterium]